ncbi:Pantoate-beta-alanine ligase [Dendrothele bispora CBS 962.96]|uniref:Pantoate--beta-alanine ligase n=1 Tax=Dendrothele bispora (strain CBS 962.96) TaxID=1314807 RepID=A0A4S8MIE0_DENBC|nr:Pantoate-beta-alanine ligase [Dendrothele bispora CBS 962.96]
MSTMALPPCPIPIFTTVASYREWRHKARMQGKSVGFVPTMGALHEGHLSLVRGSLAENDLTVLSIFVNPAQFAPHEDLATYPRTLEQDLRILLEQKIQSPKSSELRSASAVFLPTVTEMYPLGISQDVSSQKGTFVEVKDFSEQMEGKTRPTFFRGVATVVTKLFNAIEPTNAYFGQKDIQQALLLRRMVTDLLLSHPSPQNLRIIPTARDPRDNLALSSRNTYLSTEGRAVAGTLYKALKTVQEAWEQGKTKAECIKLGEKIIEEVKEKSDDVEIKLDYIEMNDSTDFEVLSDGLTKVSCSSGYREGEGGSPIILSGAMWVDKTRLIDNILLGDSSQIVR